MPRLAILVLVLALGVADTSAWGQARGRPGGATTGQANALGQATAAHSERLNRGSTPLNAPATGAARRDRRNFIQASDRPLIRDTLIAAFRQSFSVRTPTPGQRVAADLHDVDAYHDTYEEPLPRGLTIVSEMPRDAIEHESVYGVPPLPADMSTLRRAYTALGRSATTVGGDRLLETIRSADGGVVAIIGHNENGSFHTTDGTRVPLIDIALACTQARRLCVILSCRSAVVGAHRQVTVVHRDIFFEETVAWLPTLARLVSSTGGTAQIDRPSILASEIQQAMNRHFGHVRGIGVATTGGVFVIIALAAGSLCEIERETCPLA